MFCKKGALKNFVHLTGKHLCRSLFLIKLQASIKACNFIKKRLRHWCFPVKRTKFLRAPILKKICVRLLLAFFFFDFFLFFDVESVLKPLQWQKMVNVSFSHNFTFYFLCYITKLSIQYFLC